MNNIKLTGRMYYLFSAFLIAFIFIISLLLTAAGSPATIVTGTPSAAGNTPSATQPLADTPTATPTPIPKPTPKPTPTPYQTPPITGGRSKYLICVNAAPEGQVVKIYLLDQNSNTYKKLVKTMICSTGLNSSTPLGSFKTINSYRWIALQGDVYGQYAVRFNGSILFHSVPYIKNNRPDTLQWEEWNKLGQQASAGCVRLCVEDAKWIYENCNNGTGVIVYEGNNEQELRSQLKLPDIQYLPWGSWDPTDPERPDN